MRHIYTCYGTYNTEFYYASEFNKEFNLIIKATGTNENYFVIFYLIRVEYSVDNIFKETNTEKDIYGNPIKYITTDINPREYLSFNAIQWPYCCASKIISGLAGYMAGIRKYNKIFAEKIKEFNQVAFRTSNWVHAVTDYEYRDQFKILELLGATPIYEFVSGKTNHNIRYYELNFKNIDREVKWQN